MSRLRRALYLQLTGLTLAAGAVFWLARHYPVLDSLARLQQTVAEHPWGAFVYPFIYALGNVLLLPCGILAVGSGWFFGLWWGFVINLLGNVVGAAIAFQISRTFGRGWIARKFLQNPQWATLDRAIARDSWKIIFFSQLPPLSPVSLLNYLYGITRIRFSTCLLWVAIGQAPTMFLYAYLGTMTQHGLRLWRGQSHPEPLEYVIWIGGLVITLVATIILGRIALRALAEAKKSLPSTETPVQVTVVTEKKIIASLEAH